MNDVARLPSVTVPAHVAGVALFAMLACAASAASAGAGALGDASADRIHASTSIPNPSRKVGEVRLLSRGDAVVVQTLLSTKLLSRVVAEIRAKEGRNWPTGGSGAAAEPGGTAAYLAALDAARNTVEAREPGPDDDRRRRLLVEFAADAEDAAVLVGTFTGASATDLAPRAREVFSTLALPRAYILRQIRLILADSFDMDEAEVDRLGPLGPAASTATPPAKPIPPAPQAPATPAPKAPATSGPKAPAN